MGAGGVDRRHLDGGGDRRGRRDRGRPAQLEQAQDQIAARWSGWANQAADIGVQTRAVLRAAGPNPTAARLTAAATAHHQRTGRSGGNGSLMRTAPIALAYLHDPQGMAQAAASVSALTHHDRNAGEACQLWCAAIRHGVLHGTLDGLTWRSRTCRRDAGRTGATGSRRPRRIRRRTSPTTAGSSPRCRAPGRPSPTPRSPTPTRRRACSPPSHLQHALETAVRGGNDTDTVAAIAGGLLGAVWGASAVPLAWQRAVHGWPGYRARDLIRLGTAHRTGWCQ